jgi:hypothetical protein
VPDELNQQGWPEIAKGDVDTRREFVSTRALFISTKAILRDSRQDDTNVCPAQLKGYRDGRGREDQGEKQRLMFEAERERLRASQII